MTDNRTFLEYIEELIQSRQSEYSRTPEYKFLRCVRTNPDYKFTSRLIPAIGEDEVSINDKPIRLSEGLGILGLLRTGKSVKFSSLVKLSHLVGYIALIYRHTPLYKREEIEFFGYISNHSVSNTRFVYGGKDREEFGPKPLGLGNFQAAASSSSDPEPSTTVRRLSVSKLATDLANRSSLSYRRPPLQRRRTSIGSVTDLIKRQLSPDSPAGDLAIGNSLALVQISVINMALNLPCLGGNLVMPAGVTNATLTQNLDATVAADQALFDANTAIEVLAKVGFSDAMQAELNTICTDAQFAGLDVTAMWVTAKRAWHVAKSARVTAAINAGNPPPPHPTSDTNCKR